MIDPTDEDDDLADIERIAALIEQGLDDYAIPDEFLIDQEDDAAKRLGLAATIQALPVGQKLKLAMKGGREARGILIRDTARLVRKFVLNNPRISDEELVMLCKNRTADGDLIQIVTKRREWMENYQIRLALCTNPKTPLVVALRIIGTLLERDVRMLAKSKNIPAAVTSAAKRAVVNKSKPGVTGH